MGLKVFFNRHFLRSLCNSRVHVGPDVEENVPAALNDLEDHDDGDTGEKSKRTPES